MRHPPKSSVQDSTILYTIESILDPFLASLPMLASSDSLSYLYWVNLIYLILMQKNFSCHYSNFAIVGLYFWAHSLLGIQSAYPITYDPFHHLQSTRYDYWNVMSEFQSGAKQNLNSVPKITTQSSVLCKNVNFSYFFNLRNILFIQLHSYNFIISTKNIYFSSNLIF